MTEQEWLSLTDPTLMLDWARAAIRGNTTPSVLPDGYRAMSDRKMRLFDDACFAMFKLNIDDMAVQASPPPEAASLLRCIFGNPFRPPVFPKTAGCHWCAINDVSHVHVPDAWLTWHDGTVVKLAQAAYQERPGRKCEQCDFVEASGYAQTDFFSHRTGKCTVCGGSGRISDGTLDAGRLAVIADALIEAGADAESDLVRHLRGWEVGEVCVDPDVNGWDLDWRKSNSPHFRGCWAVDLLLGLS